MRPTRERKAPHPICLDRSGLADGRGGLSRDQLEEDDGLVTPVAADFPSERGKGTTLGLYHRAALSVFHVLGRLSRDPGNVYREVVDALAVRGDREDVEDDAVAGDVRARGDITAVQRLLSGAMLDRFVAVVGSVEHANALVAKCVSERAVRSGLPWAVYSTQ